MTPIHEREPSPANPAANPLKVVVIGAGGMGRAWLRAVACEPSVTLVGVADIDQALAAQALAETGSAQVPVGSDGVELARRLGADAVIDVTIPAAHHPVTMDALAAGLAVLGEKPVAATLAEALSLAAASEATGQLFMVSQSRRWNPQVVALRQHARALGLLGGASTRFAKAAHFPGFREEMAHPLLVDMAIHPFDTARYLLDAEPVSVYCESWNPPWSWFAGDAACSAVFVMDSGARYAYEGSWVAAGAETSWNGDWRISGAAGSALWDGDHPPALFLDDGHEARMHSDTVYDPSEGTSAAIPPDHPNGIAWALRVFVEAVRTGSVPMGEVHENIMSLAMVEAAVASARSGNRVALDAILGEALGQAIDNEQRTEVRQILTGWTSVRDALAAYPTTHKAGTS